MRISQTKSDVGKIQTDIKDIRSDLLDPEFVTEKLIELEVDHVKITFELMARKRHRIKLGTFARKKCKIL